MIEFGAFPNDEYGIIMKLEPTFVRSLKMGVTQSSDNSGNRRVDC